VACGFPAADPHDVVAHEEDVDPERRDAHAPIVFFVPEFDEPGSDAAA
jgi:hypothetical protein